MGHRTARVPAAIWLLGFVSLLTDVSSEIVNATLPIYLVSVLGASVAAIGWLEGTAAFIATTARTAAGVISDRLPRRKPLVVLGYALCAFSRPLIPLTATLTGIVVAKGLDRIGKGIRSAPRDALVADLSPPELRGASFGLRKSLDALGGFLGPLAAIALLFATANNYVAVFWWAAVPAFGALGLLTFGLTEPPVERQQQRPAFRWRDAAMLSKASWLNIGLAASVGLTRVSEAFLLLRAMDVGVSAMTAPLLLVILHAVYAATSYPVGRLSDRFGRRAFLLASLVALAIAHGLMAAATSPVTLWIAVAAWGFHLGLSQGSMAVFVTDATPPHLVGSALGWLSLVTGLVILAANGLFGALWTAFGPQAAFTTFAALTMALVALASSGMPATSQK